MEWFRLRVDVISPETLSVYRVKATSRDGIMTEHFFFNANDLLQFCSDFMKEEVQ